MPGNFLKELNSQQEGFNLVLQSIIQPSFMDSTTEALNALFDRIPRRHSQENVQEINSILSAYEDLLVSIEAANAYYEKQVPVFFDQLDTVRAGIKKSTDNKASKKNKDIFFDDASGTLKDSMQELIAMYGDGKQTA
jgi:hypothetical protein